MRPFSQQVLKHQLQLLRKVAVAEVGHPLRVDTFVDATLHPQMGRFVRRVGRPRQDWTTHLLREGRDRMGEVRFNACLADTERGADVRWQTELKKFFG